MPKTRVWAACALIWIAICASWVRLPDLRPEIPELDGVHPVRAAQALRDAYVPGRGLVDKYPPLGSFLMGLVAEIVDPGLLAALGAEPDALVDDPGLRRATLWPLRDRIARRLAAQRALSLAAMGAAVALVGLVAARVVVRHGGGRGAATRAGVLAAALFGCAYPTLVYGATTNLDALALLASLLALERLLTGRALVAGLALGAAVALKDPAYALAPALLAGALSREAGEQGAGEHGAPEHGAPEHGAAGHDVHDHLGGVGGLVAPPSDPGPRRRAARLVLGAACAYLLLGGALLSPASWLAHVRYLLGGGVESVTARIDHGDPIEWLQLADYTRRLLAGAIVPAWGGTLVVLAGLVGLVRLRARERRLLLGAAIGPIVFFVLPVGFAYPRFLLLTSAMLAVGAGVLVAWGERVARARGRAGLAAGVLALGALAVLGTLGPWPSLRSEDARALAGTRLAALPAGTRVGVLAGARGHGPVADPRRLPLELHGLEHVDVVMAAWRARPPEQRPDVVLVLSFPYESPDGRRGAPPAPPAVGQDVAGGLYRVVRVDGGAGTSAPERTLAWRPTISWLERAR